MTSGETTSGATGSTGAGTGSSGTASTSDGGESDASTGSSSSTGEPVAPVYEWEVALADGFAPNVITSTPEGVTLVGGAEDGLPMLRGLSPTGVQLWNVAPEEGWYETEAWAGRVVVDIAPHEDEIIVASSHAVFTFDPGAGAITWFQELNGAFPFEPGSLGMDEFPAMSAEKMALAPDGLLAIYGRRAVYDSTVAFRFGVDVDTGERQWTYLWGESQEVARSFVYHPNTDRFLLATTSSGPEFAQGRVRAMDPLTGDAPPWLTYSGAVDPNTVGLGKATVLSDGRVGVAFRLGVSPGSELYFELYSPSGELEWSSVHTDEFHRADYLSRDSQDVMYVGSWYRVNRVTVDAAIDLVWSAPYGDPRCEGLTSGIDDRLVMLLHDTEGESYSVRQFIP